MRLRVINNKLSHYNEELKVDRLNYNMVGVKFGSDKLSFNKQDVELIPENEYDNILLKYEDITKIKLNRGISPDFYKVVLDCIKETLGSEVYSINLLQDEFEELRKGLWEKRLFMLVNEEVTLFISVIGRKFGDHFDITVKDVTLRDFVAECALQIETLENEIKEKQKKIEAYKRALKDSINNYGRSANEELKLGLILSKKAVN